MTTRRLLSLDILRALAILAVLGRHMDSYPGNNPVLKVMCSTWIRGGWVGVDLFFVLSGFLIAGLLFKEHQQYHQISFKNFFIRRGFKIYPAFYFLLFVSLFEDFTTFAITPLTVASESLFLQDYLSGIWDHTWSLAVEEKFYILLPLLLIYLNRQHRAPAQPPFYQLPALFLGLAISCLVLRIWTSVTLPYSHLTHLFPFHLRMDSLFFGVLLSWFSFYQPHDFSTTARQHVRLFLFLGTALLIPPFIFPVQNSPLIYTVGPTIFYLGSGLILMALVHHDFKPAFLVNSLALIGAHSYSIYLWHIPIARWSPFLLKPLMGHYFNWLSYTLFYITISITVGIVMAKIVEFPMLRLRERFFPSRSQALFLLEKEKGNL